MDSILVGIAVKRIKEGDGEILFVAFGLSYHLVNEETKNRTPDGYISNVFVVDKGLANCLSLWLADNDIVGVDNVNVVRKIGEGLQKTMGGFIEEYKE